MVSNNIDAFVIRVEEGTYNVDRFIPTTKYDHVHTWIDRRNRDLRLRVGAKVLMSPDDVGSILSINDIEHLSPIIKKCTGIEISPQVILNSRLTSVDIKKDVHFNKPLPQVVSALREICCVSTTKQEILTYYNDVGFDNSLLIKSTCKSVKDSLCIYNKWYEMWLKRNNDCGYYSSLSNELKEKYKNVLRFERRIQWAKALRKALNIQQGEKITLQHIFDYPYDIVGEKVKKMIGEEIGENN